ncbi:LOG family protein [Polynucleobacter paneuropaeus]|uniref:AMP nucleosidase n=1 Tax=Polynucleobacter paneuropaeus TaxID=2527775 RepID=A0A2Z4JT29_9BURK|nr:LOG family protein [Polynucleobacter paneuropaeus]AWW49947.1 3-isopropylmalate dehydrogenase [Polynucleobacter paneuropaeus]MBT8515873.1 LOG family protein [Polynucleobacter paneuropaeus]MBT8519674.1 LOG family protein [Polynucleobacter paneuropaeus]MBT8536806.1 LOG family protein [Polynucleobacter paneuropaeus]MBT8554109.1 LOG family protein [Polynucleobacter paneuropaeus]
MSPKLPVNNSQTITEFFNLHKEDLHEATTDESYKFAFADEAFLARKETMGIRFELELLKPDILLREHGIEHTITVFGSTRFISHDQAEKRAAQAKTSEEQFEAKRAVDNSHFYEEARKFGALVAQYNTSQSNSNNKLHICTGGGPGIMEAASRGAFENGDQTIGFNISLPREQKPNPYLTEGLSFRFHYFALRKMHFMLRARAIVAFPGGFGSFDELFEVLTLMQTHKVAQLPIILVGKTFWENSINFNLMTEYGVIERTDMKLIHFTETAEETWQIIQQWYQLA